MTTWTVRRQTHEQLVKTGLAANGAPTLATQGMALLSSAGPGHLCPQARVTLKSTVGTSFTSSVWLFDPTAEQWIVDTTLGTAGLITTTTATLGGKQSLLANTRGASRIYVQTITFNGANEEADAWVTGLTTP